jgi:putative NIF3 family GTP cyclohydrolase 1 type 2
MTIQQIYDLGIEMAKKADPRGEKEVENELIRLQTEYKELSGKKKEFFDKESLTNPYADSRILNGDPKTEVKTLMAGIDADASEVLLMDRLREKGEKIDLLLSHHPSGRAYAGLHEVMEMQAEMFAQAGVPINVSHSLLQERMGQVHRKISPANHNQAVDAARLLDVPLMSLHTIADNLGNKFMQEYLAKKTFHTVGEIYDYVCEIPEFVESAKGKAGPFIAAGSENSRAGKITIGFTGGTNVSKELYMELSKAGVGTLVEMHVSEDVLVELKKLHINVVDMGHMAADSLGMNLILDELEKQGIKVIPCSGLIRVRRTK